MAGRPMLPVFLSARVRRELERRTRSAAVTRREAERARIVLCRADGLSREETARRVGCSEVRVTKWVVRFRQMGLPGLVDRPGRGRKSGAKRASSAEAARRARSAVEGLGPDIRTPRPIVSHQTSGRRRRTPRDSRHEAEVKKLFSKISDSGKVDRSATATVHSVARAAGVSPMTVSRVFHGRPNVRPSVRRRVLEAAGEQGYRPDPQLQKLMLHLRQRRVRRLQGSICALTPAVGGAGGRFHCRKVLEGARSRADALGFAWETALLDEMVGHPGRTVRILNARGVEGVLLAPVHHSRNLPPEEIWNDFSVIMATYSIPDPGFHRVVPDQFRNMQVICKALSERGCKRIGLVISKRLDEKVQYHFSGAFAAFHFQRDREMLPVFYLKSVADSGLADWYARARPDAIIAESDWSAHQIAEVLGAPVVLAAVSLRDPSVNRAGGIDELPETVGARAVERLAGMIVRGERGLPDHPTVTMIEGVWHGGAGCGAGG